MQQHISLTASVFASFSRCMVVYFFSFRQVCVHLLHEAAKCNKVCKVKVVEKHPFEYSEGNLPVALRERNTGDL